MAIINFIKNLFTKTEARKIFFIYLLLAFIGGLLLWLPISQQKMVRMSFLDTLFISISELSSTGLTPVPLHSSLSLFGGIVSILLLEIGGIGIILLMTSLTVFLGRKIGIKELNVVAFEQNQFTIKNIFSFIRNAVIAILVLQFFYIIIMSLYLFIKQPWEISYWGSLYQSIFLAVSSFANAGFDLLPNNESFIIFQKNGLYFPQILTMLLVFLGGIGFWPLAESVVWIKKTIKKEKYRFSFLAKLLVLIHFLLWLFSSIIFYFLERNNSLSTLSISDSMIVTTFMTTAVRSAGFYNTNINTWTPATKFFMALLMFIGAAPNSSGGGIRLTTLLLVIISLYSFGKRRKQAFLHKKAIKEEALKKAYVVFTAAIILVFLSSFLILIIENLEMIEVFFEVLSAFGTVGLSLSVTPQLTSFSKVILMIVMFIGRIGILTFIQILDTKKETTNVVSYSEIDIIVG
ncbi:MAG: potassium transporter TrkG [Acholeplasmataceae bacterium]|nr:potassium transporter TrkG [Acholeplasmataceae bacterium]